MERRLAALHRWYKHDIAGISNSQQGSVALYGPVNGGSPVIVMLSGYPSARLLFLGYTMVGDSSSEIILRYHWWTKFNHLQVAFTACMLGQ